MKTLLLLRHAKSSWAKPDLSDHDRPLNERGERDAPRMGRWIAKLGLRPDLVLSSTAKRAKATSEIAMKHAELDCELRLEPDLYLAPPEEFVRILSSVDDGCDCVMMVAHNPGTETLIEMLTGEYESVPTGALAHIESPVDSWSEVRLDRGAKLVDLYRPKEIDID